MNFIHYLATNSTLSKRAMKHIVHIQPKQSLKTQTTDCRGHPKLHTRHRRAGWKNAPFWWLSVLWNFRNTCTISDGGSNWKCCLRFAPRNTPAKVGRIPQLMPPDDSVFWVFRSWARWTDRGINSPKRLSNKLPPEDIRKSGLGCLNRLVNVVVNYWTSKVWALKRDVYLLGGARSTRHQAWADPCRDLFRGQQQSEAHPLSGAYLRGRLSATTALFSLAWNKTEAGWARSAQRQRELLMASTPLSQCRGSRILAPRPLTFWSIGFYLLSKKWKCLHLGWWNWEMLGKC